ncbi:MAG: phosphoenolpyruvate--protein phosphotransferase [Deltaproteobacteria bacterium]|nr:phosphoenolpyruvate--protein phosphotransferase [Deltaproteobacteria bacterium]
MTAGKEIIMKGIGVSPGIVIGKAYPIDGGRVEAPAYCPLDTSYILVEVKRFKKAVKMSRDQLTGIRKRLLQDAKGKDHVYIIDAHIMMLKDQMLIEDTIRTIKKERINAEWALKLVLKGIKEFFDRIDDTYMRERGSDIEHIGDSILRNLLGHGHRGISDIEKEVVVVAHDLAPADTAQMVKGKVLGFLTDIGGRTSHTAIMARALDIPAVVGLENISQKVGISDVVIVDGINGTVIINPSRTAISEYKKKKGQYAYYGRVLHHYKALPAETSDGRRIRLVGNIEVIEEIPSLLEHGAEGIGLYRTEFLYLNRRDTPSEEEHLRAYRDVVKKLYPRPVVIRTLDIGGDKFLSPMELAEEINPALGLRAIRLCLEKVDIFKPQLRGILRASVFGKVKVMFPMISGVEELRKAKAILEEAKGELRSEGKPFDPDIEVGVMIEVPSAALIADILAREVNFFSIGTNDLLQYSLAIDRVNEHVAYLYKPLHPAVLRVIKDVVEAGHNAGIEVGICGEMACEPEYTLILIGLGLDQMSMNALSLLKVKRVIRSVTYSEARRIVEKALTLSTTDEVEAFVGDEMKRRFPGGLWPEV